MRLLNRAPALLLLLAVTPAAAQEIRGRLLEDATGLPIEAAAVTLVDEKGVDLGTVLTDSAGQFLLRLPTGGRYTLRAERLGYESVTGGPLDAATNDTIQVEFRIAADAIPLDPLVVIAQAKVRYLDRVGFYDRQRTGFGYFLTRKDIRMRYSQRMTDLLRSIPGVRVVGRPPSQDVVMRGSNCLPQIVVDGVIARRGGDRALMYIDDFVIPMDIEGLEVYRGASELPAEFGGKTSGCGVIAIWTRDPRSP